MGEVSEWGRFRVGEIPTCGTVPVSDCDVCISEMYIKKHIGVITADLIAIDIAI